MAQIITNPSFESGTEGWSLESDYSRSEASPHTGLFSILQESVAEYSNFASDALTVEGGERYILKFFSKVAIASGNAPIVRVTYGTIYGDAPTGTTIFERKLSASSGYVLNTIDFFVPAAVSEVYVRFFNNNGEVTAYYDDFSLEKVSPTITENTERNTPIDASTLLFNGTDAEVQTLDHILLRPETGNCFSYAMRFKIFSYSNNVLPRLCEKGAHFLCIMGDSGNGKYRKLAIEVAASEDNGNGNGGVSEFWGSTQLELDTWYDLVATFDGNLEGTEPTVYQGKLYLNGKAETMDNIFAWSGELADTVDSALKIARSGGADRFLNGRIRDFRFWQGVVLTEEQAKAYSNGDTVGGETLIYDFIPGASETTLYDRAGSNDGTTNAVWQTVPLVGADTFFTAKSPQESVNKALGLSPTGNSLQETLNSFFGKPVNWYDVQSFLNACLGKGNSDLSVQEALFELVKTSLGLTGNYTQYDLQDIFYRMSQNSIHIGMLPFLRLTGLFGYWALNDAVGAATAKDFSGNNKPATLTAVTGQVDGKRGKATRFNGSSSLMALTDFTMPTAAFSVGCLLKKASTPDANDRFIDWSDSGPSGGFNFTTSSEKIAFTVYNSTTATANIQSGDLTPGTYYLLVATFAPNSAKFYVNGVQVGSTDTSCAISLPTQTVTVMRRSAAATNFSAGDMQHLFICNQVLSAAEIARLASLLNV